MAMRALAQRLCVASSPFPRMLRCRTFSNGKGRVLSEEERAAESIYIQKMEKEKIEKLAHKGVEPEENNNQGSASKGKSAPMTESSSYNIKNISVLATVVALAAAGWWYVRSSARHKEEEKV